MLEINKIYKEDCIVGMQRILYYNKTACKRIYSFTSETVKVPEV